jgi:hypothetical protein
MRVAKIRRLWSTGWGAVEFVGDSDYVPDGRGKITWIDLTGYTPTPPDPYVREDEEWFYEWQTDTFTNVQPVLTPPTTPRIIHKEEFWNRFTWNEKAALWASISGVDLPGVSFGSEVDRWRLRAWRDLSITGDNIDLDDNPVQVAVNTMETAGILDPGRAAIILG